MADISKLEIGNTTYNLKDANAVHGVKGNAESSYRTGNVNLTLQDLGIHVDSIAPENITTATVPIGEFYIYVG